MEIKPITPQGIIIVLDSYKSKSIEDDRFIHNELTVSNPLLKEYSYFDNFKLFSIMTFSKK